MINQEQCKCNRNRVACWRVRVEAATWQAAGVGLGIPLHDVVLAGLIHCDNRRPFLLRQWPSSILAAVGLRSPSPPGRVFDQTPRAARSRCAGGETKHNSATRTETDWHTERATRATDSPKLQALVYDIRPSTIAVFSYAIGSANEQFFCWCSDSSRFLLQTTQIKQGVSFIAVNKLYTSTDK